MGLEIDIFWLTVLMFGSLLVLLMAGLPLAFVTGGLACVFLFVFGDADMLNILPSRIFPLMTDYQLTAIPMFILMASILERAGIIEELYDMVYKLLGSLKGGLGISTIIASTLLAAMCGVIGATEVTMGLIALPAMIRRKYHPTIACGSILAGGTLGILIPPSILAILFAVIAQQSVGELFIGAVVPGLLLSGMYILYISLMTNWKPELGPPLPVEERVSTREKIRLLGNMLAPLVLVTLVLGIIFAGIATPVEAAGVGTFGALVVAAMHRRLTLDNIRSAAMTTLRVTGMVLWIIFGATLFVGFYVVNGGQEFINESIAGTGLGPYGILILMMVILVILGMFLDWVGILLLAVPIFIPLLKTMSFDGVFGLPGVAPEEMALWFGVVYMVNMQMSFISPPFGYALFYLKSVAPPEVTMGQIYRSSLPFLFLQATGLAICIIFPDVVLWLPRQVYGG
jgi:tripartite ATP-independent transporter DctM subunit